MANILLLQFDPQVRTIEENIHYILSRISSYTDALVILPEFSLSSYYDYNYLPRSHIHKILEPLRLLGYSKALSFVGSLPVKSNARKYNRGFYLSPESLQTKDKINLYGTEQAHMTAGHPYSNSSFIYKNIMFSLQICLDIVNPLFSQEAVKKGAKLLINPATVSVDFLCTINKARALENQVVSVFCNRAGEEANGIQYLGKSGVFFPDNTEMRLESEPGILRFSMGA